MPAPAFILGCGRSGTTLVSAILDSHPQLDVPLATGLYSTYGDFVPVPGVDEDIGPRQWRRLVELLISDVGIQSWKYRPSFADVDARVERRNFGSAFRGLHQFHADRAGKPVWVAKSIQSVLCLPRVYRDFPDARYINCIRDGRDVVLSLLQNDFGPTDLVSASWYWSRHVDAWTEALEWLPEQQRFTLHFEQLIHDPERVVRALLQFLGVPYHGDCINFFQGSRSREMSRFPEHANVARGMDVSVAGKYRRGFSAGEIRQIEAIAGGALLRWGYPLETGAGGAVAPPEASIAVRAGHLIRSIARLAGTSNRARRAGFIQRHYRRLRYRAFPIR